MAEVIPLTELQFSPTAWLFEGKRAGAPISTFIVASPPGVGPGLHVHPYPETFYVFEGQARFRAGEETIDVEAGNVVVVPAETPHGFKNTGDGTLRVFSVHPSPEVIQTWLEDD